MLEFKQINKAFDGKTVAEHINLTVADGQLLAILGPSGCGKSTLLNLAAGLLEPDSGEIWLNNQNCTHVAPEKRRVALMFQDYALFPHLNVWQNVAFGLKMQSVTTQEARQRAERMLIQVGLGIATILSQVAIPLAALHQAGALILLALLLRRLHIFKHTV